MVIHVDQHVLHAPILGYDPRKTHSGRPHAHSSTANRDSHGCFTCVTEKSCLILLRYSASPLAGRHGRAYPSSASNSCLLVRYGTEFFICMYNGGSNLQPAKVINLQATYSVLKHLSLLVVASLAHGRLTTKGFYSALSTHDYLLVRSCCTMLFNHHRNRHRCSFATLDYDAIPMVTLNPIADRTLILRLLLTYRIGIDDVGVNVGLTSPLYGKLDSSQSVHNRTDGRKDFMNATAKLSNKTY